MIACIHVSHRQNWTNPSGSSLLVIVPMDSAKRVKSSSDAASRRMRATRRRDTLPERLLRSELHRRGLRYRVDYPVLPRRRADVVFPVRQLAVFVDGCFWHGCPVHGTLAKANAAFWKAKISANRERDHNTDVRLAGAGWEVVRIWEHQSMSEAADFIEAIVRDRMAAHS